MSTYILSSVLELHNGTNTRRWKSPPILFSTTLPQSIFRSSKASVLFGSKFPFTRSAAQPRPSFGKLNSARLSSEKRAGDPEEKSERGSLVQFTGGLDWRRRRRDGLPCRSEGGFRSTQGGLAFFGPGEWKDEPLFFLVY